MRERYYGRAAVAMHDIEWALAVAGGRPSHEPISGSAELLVLRGAVAAYCGTCANMNANHPSGKPYCFDGDCELRPASPLPLRHEL